ncbi:hypothetical protein BCR42DRAFT_430495 [Absidia repens]|uniref:Heterokaryon incompatibility domain-containing protein n=1 Tax=Absidia repens TaxID=90262 RepID=A0A1X2HDW1_9FUNG|nr:hypothetical protein BCR42DRAFT_430495 [Absidia repens]
MNNIYDRATYILAVPDLHLSYLKGVSKKNSDTIEGSSEYRVDICYLIEGDTYALAEVEEDFLNYIDVPKDPPALRQLLLHYTDYFAHSFMERKEHHYSYCPVRALDHICETTTRSRDHHHGQNVIKDSKEVIGELHQCHETICPLEFFVSSSDRETEIDLIRFDNSNWKSKILERSDRIQQSMEFLVDLVKDWSSRVWVISEFNIAKNKNNLKYWFTQLSLTYRDFMAYDHTKRELTFFKFNFHYSSLSGTIINTPYYYVNQDKSENTSVGSTTPNSIYKRFHYTLNHQLSKQTFLEMILSSKTSRNEDRFYSILPISEYAKEKAQVSRWKINSMVSVKLKLYEVMSTKDRLALFFWSANNNAVKKGVLPTFATSTLPLAFKTELLINIMTTISSNFDLGDPFSIMLLKDTNHSEISNDANDSDSDSDDDDSNRYYLRLKPKEYYVVNDDDYSEASIDLLKESIPLCKRLGIHDASTATLKIVSIPAFQKDGFDRVVSEYKLHLYFLILVGCFVKNKWIISCKHYQNYPHTESYLRWYKDDGEYKKPVKAFKIY